MKHQESVAKSSSFGGSTGLHSAAGDKMLFWIVLLQCISTYFRHSTISYVHICSCKFCLFLWDLDGGVICVAGGKESFGVSTFGGVAAFCPEWRINRDFFVLKSGVCNTEGLENRRKTRLLGSEYPKS